MKTYRSLNEMRELVTKHAPKFEDHIRNNVLTVHPSHTDRHRISHELSQSLIYHHALLHQLEEERPDLQGAIERCTTSLDHSTSLGDKAAFQRSERFTIKLLMRAISDRSPGSSDPLQDKVRKNLFLIFNKTAQIKPAKVTPDMLAQPAQAPTQAL